MDPDLRHDRTAPAGSGRRALTRELLQREGPSAPNERQRQQSDYVRYAGLGLQFAGTFLVFGAVGYWLDGRLHTRPWLMIVGIALGAAGAFWSMLRQVPPARGSSHHASDGDGPNRA